MEWLKKVQKKKRQERQNNKTGKSGRYREREKLKQCKTSATLISISNTLGKNIYIQNVTQARCALHFHFTFILIPDNTRVNIQQHVLHGDYFML